MPRRMYERQNQFPSLAAVGAAKLGIADVEAAASADALVTELRKIYGVRRSRRLREARAETKEGQSMKLLVARIGGKVRPVGVAMNLREVRAWLQSLKHKPARRSAVRRGRRTHEGGTMANIPSNYLQAIREGFEFDGFEARGSDDGQRGDGVATFLHADGRRVTFYCKITRRFGKRLPPKPKAGGWRRRVPGELLVG
jgi:hypothetical protein